jgi:hypothetical protein
VSDLTDPDLPLMHYDPEILVKLCNAHQVMHAAEDESIREQQEAVSRIANSHAEHIARCTSIYHALMAEAFAAGFTTEQVSLQLDCHG